MYFVHIRKYLYRFKGCSTVHLSNRGLHIKNVSNLWLKEKKLCLITNNLMAVISLNK